MSKNTSRNSCSIGFVGTLTLIFVVLKLVHVIDWSWWWVLSPALGIDIILLSILGIVVMIQEK